MILGSFVNIFKTEEKVLARPPVQEEQKKKYKKRNIVYRFSGKQQLPLPEKKRARDTSRYVSKSTVQGRLTSKILTLAVGEMFSLTFNSDPSEVSQRLTVFRKRFPDVKITTRRIGENTIGIWRV